MLNLAPIHEHIHGLLGFSVPSVLNAVMEVPAEIQGMMQLPSAPPHHLWVMFLTRTLVVGNAEEARRIFAMLHQEEMHATEPNLSDADRVLRFTQAMHDFDTQLTGVEWPTALRAPSMPFVVPATQLVSVDSLGIVLYRGAIRVNGTQPLTDDVSEQPTDKPNHD